MIVIWGKFFHFLLQTQFNVHVYSPMKESVRIMRFAVVGTLNALITAAVVGLLMKIEGEDYMIANIIAYIIAQIHNFLWCKYWIFPVCPHSSVKKTISRQILYFMGAFGVAYTTQFFFLLVLVELLHCNEYFAQFLGLFVYGSINFLMNKYATFR